MSEQTTFGRRRTPAASAPADALALSPAAEAFRAELASARGANPDGFAEWHRAQRMSRILIGLASLALLFPGAICWALNMPPMVSGGLEVAGIAFGWWLRQERRRRISEIATWDAPPDVGAA